MDRTTALPATHQRRRRLIAAVLVVLVVVVALPLAYQARYAGAIYPGVRVGGIDVGGLAPAAAAKHLSDTLAGTAGQVTLRDPEDKRTWQRAATDLGLVTAPEARAKAALAVGRTGWNPLARLFGPLWLRFRPVNLPLTDVLDIARARTTLAALASAVDVAPTNAVVNEVAGKLVQTPGTLGHQLDITGTLHSLVDAVGPSLPARVDLAVTQTSARLPDLGNLELAYNTAVSGPLSLGWLAPTRLEIPQDTLKSWVRIADVTNPQGDTVPALVFDRNAIAAWLTAHRGEVDRPAQSARFGFDNNGQLVVNDPGQDGFTLDVARSVDAVIQAAYTDERQGTLVVTKSPSQVGPEALSQMAHLGEIARASTSLRDLPPERLKTLLAGAGRLRGAAVPPGGAFSFNDTLGPLTAAAGFDPTVLAPSGPDPALTQLATAVFRTAFWAGFPIIERNAPPWRIGQLEPPVGLDAAVTADGEDLRFINDSTGFVVFDTAMDAPRGILTVYAYGVDRGRTVETIGPRVTNVRPAAPPSVQHDPRLPAGTRVQLSAAREGADAVVERTAHEGGAVVAHDTFTSHYAPVGNTVLVGGR
jgi:vancomycin resistance protein YoaR